MGNQVNCCCHVRQLEPKPEPAKNPKPHKQKKKKTAKPKILKENPQNFFSPEVADFLEKIQTKPPETPAENLDETTEDSTIIKTTQITTSFTTDTQIIDKDNEIIYIDLPEYSLESV